MDLAKFREYDELRKRIGTLEDDLKVLKNRRMELEQSMVDDFAEEGVKSLKVDLGNGQCRTYSMVRVLHGAVKLDMMPAFLAKLDDIGLGDLAQRKIHPSRLDAFVRELDESNHNKGVGDEWGELISMYEQYVIRSRAS